MVMSYENLLIIKMMTDMRYCLGNKI